MTAIRPDVTMAAALERFQAKWKPVRVKKTRQIKNLEPRFDSIETEKALAVRSRTRRSGSRESGCGRDGASRAGTAPNRRCDRCRSAGDGGRSGGGAGRARRGRGVSPAPG